MTKLVLPQTSRILSKEHDRIISLRRESILEGNPPTLSIPEWIAVMDPFITEKHSHGLLSYRLGDTRAELSDFAEIAAMSCAAFNGLPERHRTHKPEDFTPKPFVFSAERCDEEGQYRSYWWGPSLYLNHCACIHVGLLEASAGAITGFLAALIGGIPAIVLSAVAAFLAIESAWLLSADAYCDNGGAFVQQTWLSLGTPWIKNVC